MNRHLLFLLPILIAVGLPAASANDDIDARVRAFVLERYQDGRRLIEGITPSVTPDIDPTLDCQALYAERIAILRRGVDFQPAYWDDRRNQTAVFLGTIWTPAFYFLGYSAITSHLDDLDRYQSVTQFDHLSAASAAHRCFER